MSKLLQDSAFFCLAISLIGYEIGIILRQKTKLALCNPLLISIVFVIIILKVTNIKYEVSLPVFSPVYSPVWPVYGSSQCYSIWIRRSMQPCFRSLSRQRSEWESLRSLVESLRSPLQLSSLPESSEICSVM